MPRPKRTEAEVQWRRERILAASAAVFQRVGFAAASMDEIAREAGYSTGALYNYFKGKDEIFVAALEQMTTQFEAVFSAEVPEGVDFEARIRWQMMRLNEVVFANRGLIMALDGGDGPPALGAYAPRVQDCQSKGPQMWLGIVGLGQAEGTLRTDLSPEFLSFALLGMFKGALLPLLVATEPPTLEALHQATSRLLDLFLDGARKP